jgi:hypothetical protein
MDQNEQQSERIIFLEHQLIAARNECERLRRDYQRRSEDFDNLLDMMSAQCRYIKYLEEHQREE